VSHHHELRVRYGECDMQQVVFNANYFAYIDDATDTWFRAAGIEGFEVMLKKVTLEWHASARFGDVLEMEVEAVHWGRTSFHVSVRAHVGDRAVFDAVIVYVSTVPPGSGPGSGTPTPIPDAMRVALGAP
jgi:acyl-CoA thioester hydrolase